MTERTETTVITPMITPSRVSPDRSLFRRNACSETANISENRMTCFLLRSGRPGALPFGGLLLLLRHLLHAIAVLDLAQRLEGTGDDLFARGNAGDHLDHQLARDPGLDGREGRLALAQRVDPLLRPELAGLVLLALGRIAHDHRGQGHRGHLLLDAG